MGEEGAGRGGEKGFARCRICDSFKSGARLEFHVGWSGWTRPPTMGGRGIATRFKRKVLEGSERPEAG